MNVRDNTHTVKLCDKKTTGSMSKDESSNESCQFCGEIEETTHVAILGEQEETNSETGVKKMFWLCEEHFKKLSESNEYRVRETAPEVELGHSTREENEEPSGKYVTILEPDNENKWFRAPEDLETDLRDVS